ncbi:acyl carrier protein [Streptomyces sp. NPDC048279]|uniref:acyl carrier protein n=1 Tax=Streptomyces sp. NPDC048279 TaxID=3154714 RepID=UPI0034297C11
MTEATVPSAVSSEPVRTWLVGRVAYYLECAPADVDASAQLTELGLDSVYALSLCGDVEDHYGLVVEPTMAWDHPTVDAITAYLAAELAR